VCHTDYCCCCCGGGGGGGGGTELHICVVEYY
jgi:hypothetical protein